MVQRMAQRDIPYAVKNRALDIEGYGSMWTKSTPEGLRRGGYNLGYLPDRLRKIVMERADSIVQVIYSYNTPIAWLDAGQWIVPDVSYSPTSGKHRSYLSVLDYELIPEDCPLDEYLRVLNAQMRYIRSGSGLKTVPWNYRENSDVECNCSNPYCQA